MDSLSINTCPRRDTDRLSKFWESIDVRHALRVSEEQQIERGLQSVGLEPDDIDIVLLTPLTRWLTITTAMRAMSTKS